MKKVSVLVTNKALIAPIGNARYMFGLVNEFLKNSGSKPLFEVRLVGASPKVELDDGLYTINVDDVLEDVNKTNLIIIPPLSGAMEPAVASNMEYVSWLKKQYSNGAEIASLCVGAFLLAETGLLNGIQCSTHWNTINEFKKRYPEVNLVDYKIITDYKGLYTSGGANSYWNLLIYLVQKFTNRDIAVRTSKYFEVELDRDNQSPFIIFEGYKLHTDEIILQAQEFIEENYETPITIGRLCEQFNMSRRTFERRFKVATQQTLIEYLQKIRVEAAKKLLEHSMHTISEVMDGVGYKDPKAFRDIFKKITGTTPLVYKTKYEHSL
jgi:transcriptional regulator GlxA family with amidase domain